MADLFFSEYIEGSSFNKALEIYNGTGSAVDLAVEYYVVEMYFNGSTTPSLSINLVGTVANGDVYVLAQSSANPAILAQSDQTNSFGGWFNGDDAIVLRKGGPSGIIVDSIGQIGFDPGSEWGTGVISTADNTLRRKSSITSGDNNPSNTFDPSSEWEGFTTDTFDGLGSHTIAAVTPTVTIAATDANAAEAGQDPGTFRITRTGSTTNALTVNYTIGGIATNGTDYTPNLTGTTTIAAGQDFVDITITPVDDTAVEGSENVTLTLVDAANYDLGATTEATVTIADNDHPSVNLTPNNDVYRGTASNEQINGLAGDDVLYGNAGNDRIFGNDGNDVVYGGNDNDSISGGLGSDRLYGDVGNDLILGDAGNDILYGGEGDDILDGGVGSDQLYGNNGRDTFVLASGMGWDYIYGFQDGLDNIQLDGGLTFDALKIVQSGSSTLIKVLATGETLGSLMNTNSALIDAANFSFNALMPN